ncbi:MAG TPA: 30S ribosomal protein S20 [Candidatus Wallbacteria bacterium]|nr:MAG: 30S ribosomal protein S20 [bacterium ADurb.Bin243]HPG59989.1 30S ribosomal protein S20 [Candidatus Wallbacteria bacterium]
MPRIKSQIARLKTNNRNNIINKARKSQLKTAIKKFEAVLATNNKDEILKASKQVESIIDSTARTGTIHRNKAARTKSRLQKQINKAVSNK